jgi:hypothetical protein
MECTNWVCQEGKVGIRLLNLTQPHFVPVPRQGHIFNVIGGEFLFVCSMSRDDE